VVAAEPVEAHAAEGGAVAAALTVNEPRSEPTAPQSLPPAPEQQL
jgi:hypothetical protein